MRAQLFHNPKAGIEKAHNKKGILGALKLAGYDVTEYRSTRGADFKSAAKKIRLKDDTLLVIAGGDGTIGKVIRRMHDRRIPIALLPLGTANNIARSFGIAGLPHVLTETWRPHRPLRFDIGIVKGPWGKENFLETYGIGVIPRLMVAGNKDGKNVEGAHAIAYGRKVLQRLLKRAKAFPVTIVVDGARMRKEVLGVEVMNLPFTGPALPLAPEASSGDGALDVVCFDADKRDELIAWVGTPIGSPPGTVHRGKRIAITWAAEPQRIDEKLKPAQTSTQTVHLSCEKKPARVLKCWLAPEPSQMRFVSGE